MKNGDNLGGDHCWVYHSIWLEHIVRSSNLWIYDLWQIYLDTLGNIYPYILHIYYIVYYIVYYIIYYIYIYIHIHVYINLYYISTTWYTTYTSIYTTYILHTYILHIYYIHIYIYYIYTTYLLQYILHYICYTYIYIDYTHFATSTSTCTLRRPKALRLGFLRRISDDLVSLKNWDKAAAVVAGLSTKSPYIYIYIHIYIYIYR